MSELGVAAQLLRSHAYDGAASLLAARVQSGPVSPELRRALELVELARRVLDLDAEDFAELATLGAGRPWADALARCAFPRRPDDPDRGALGSLVPLYELMLEVLQLRAARGEPLQVVVTAHLVGEYLRQLAWEPRLGHGGDPLRLGDDVGERWGTDDPSCSHPAALRATARRALNACSGDEAGYLAYLDKFHSRQGDALAVCAMNHKTVQAGERPEVGPTCAKPCSWALRGSVEERRALDARCRLALVYTDSPLLALRHHAPVGHFFAVPSTEQIAAAWEDTWRQLTTPWRDGDNPLAGAAERADDGGAPDADGPLPGLSLLVSTVAARPVRAAHLVRAIADDAADALAAAPESSAAG